jgi:PAP2 superfamily
MKRAIYTLVLVYALLLISCSKEYPTGIEFAPYEFSSLDFEGGNWKPILLTNNAQISIPQPSNITSDEYKSELSAMKNAMEVDGNNTSIAYWGNNPIVRWNEIARELAAKYNLTPAPNEDGTFTQPDPSKPDVYPYFPFAHPPYVCRALAYLSAAQFDGMIAAWHYKYKFNRPAVYLIDNTVKPVFPLDKTPSYPSDGAVISAISREILSAFFPLEKQYLQQQANQMQKSLVASGLNVQSDITAGDSLGRGVAKIFLKRASSDGMSKAQVSKPVSDSLRNAAKTRFGWEWINQETPQRPVGITPFYGKLKLWSVPKVEDVRPLPPPAPGSLAFNKAVEELKSLENNLTVEQRRIANWWSDGLSTYTPPGHWNRIATDYIVKYKLNPIRTARVYAYLNMAMQDAGISCWDTKYYYHYPRPIQALQGFKTILGTPNFPSYTSGHSTFSASAAAFLSYVFPNEKTIFDDKALEASMSRIYGGIHFRFDAEAGLAAGKKIAEYTIQKAMIDGSN